MARNAQRTSSRQRTHATPIPLVVLILFFVGMVPGKTSIAQTIATYEYEWTKLDRISKVTGSTGQTDFAYDGDGLRVSKQSEAGSRFYVRDSQGRVIAEYDGAGELIAEHVYAGAKRVAKILPSGRRLYYHADIVGTPFAITDQEGELVWRGESLPFGKEVVSNGLDDEQKFTGKERDAETGQHYFEARYYDEEIGRFLSIDEAGGRADIPQSWNRYAYALNNPLGLVDPDGRQETEAQRGFDLPALVMKIRAVDEAAQAVLFAGYRYSLRVLADGSLIDGISADLGDMSRLVGLRDLAKAYQPLNLDGRASSSRLKLKKTLRRVGKGTVNGLGIITSNYFNGMEALFQGGDVAEALTAVQTPLSLEQQIAVSVLVHTALREFQAFFGRMFGGSAADRDLVQTQQHIEEGIVE